MTTPTETRKSLTINSEQGMVILLTVIITLSVVAVFLVGG